MNRRTFLTALVASFLLVAALPTSSAYIGHQLSRADVADFSLTDQNNSEFNFSQNAEKVNVVSFIFTSCPDVCPVITQSLKQVQMGLSEEDSNDVQFVSITVDPRHDTPERLHEYTQLHGVEWPHLTGEQSLLEDAYATFGILVDEIVIEAHISNTEPTVTYVDTNNSTTELMFSPTGWTLHQSIVDSANWTVNASDSEYGHFITSIEGFEAPSDSSWWWSLLLFNTSSMTWEESPVGIDSVNALDHPHLAWAASIANHSGLEHPSGDDASMQIVFPDSTTANHTMSEFNAWHLSMGAFAGADINTSMPSSQYGHYMDSIDDVTGPSDSSWWWNLFVWNQSSDSWDTSDVGMDGLVDPPHIAWAPSSVNQTDIPTPDAFRPSSSQSNPMICNGKGWEMGSGAGKHCMCDEGYEWAEDDRLSCVSTGENEQEFSVGHSSITYILKGMKPIVAWTGDDWKADDFLEDIERVLGTYSSASDVDSLPGMTLLIALSGISMAAIVVRVGVDSEEDEA
tara:strand:- start:5713 stop:7248 length:1536 start_codon:yes stop_codon:yes gene_type:complete